MGARCARRVAQTAPPRGAGPHALTPPRALTPLSRRACAHSHLARSALGRSRVFPWNVYELANEYIGQKLHLSEYDTYGSWLTTHHPERVVAVRLPYERNPTALVTHARQSKVCCLSEATVCAFDARSWPRVPLLIWEEHKLRHRDKQCDDEDATAD